MAYGIKLDCDDNGHYVSLYKMTNGIKLDCDNNGHYVSLCKMTNDIKYDYVIAHGIMSKEKNMTLNLCNDM